MERTKNELMPEIVAFVEQEILPQYVAFGKSHGVDHVTRVIANSMDLARMTEADVNMAYVIAAYHDVGMCGPRETHHLLSAQMLMEDERLSRWFTEDELVVMKEAVEDHRASASHAPRSLYGKIVAEADRDIDAMTIFRRTVQYGLEHEPHYNKEEQWQRFCQHMEEKYSERGYLKLWIAGSKNEEKLKELRRMIEDGDGLRRVFEEIYGEECRV